MSRSFCGGCGGAFVHSYPYTFFFLFFIVVFSCLQFSHLDSGSYLGTIMYSCGVFAGWKGTYLCTRVEFVRG